MVGRNMFDDRESQSGASGLARSSFVDAEESLEYAFLVGFAIPSPRSVTAMATFPPRIERLTDTGEPLGEYAIAFSMRLDSAVTSKV